MVNIERFIVGYLQTNCYVIYENDIAIIIDPGGGFDKIKQFLDENKLTPKACLITHGHFDHILDIHKWKELGLKIYISSIDSPKLELNKDNLCNEMGLKFLPSKADYYLNNNDEFNISNMNFKIIATPGHTNGSICYLLNDKYLFTGDTLFYHSFGRTDFPTGDYNELMKSLEFLSNLNYDYIVLPGHGESTSIFDEKEFIKNVRD